MTDPTDIDALRAALQRSRDDFDGLLYAVSHDLRAPLRAVDGFSRLLEEEGWTEEGPSHLRVIRENTDRLRRMIEGLLELSRRSREVVRRGPVDMGVAAQGALDELRAAGRVGDVQVTLQPLQPCQAHLPFIVRLWSVLLDNACKFGARHVTVGCECGDGGEVVWFVHDDGSGFDRGRADRLFTPFQRFHGLDWPGVGMGLAIARLVVSKHGGRIWADAAPEEGARFSFTIPNG